VVFLFFCCFPIGVCETEQSDTIYVDDNNSEGPWDGSPDHPYFHIQDAIENATNGDTIFVFNGFYSGNILIDKSVSLIGENNDLTVIYGGKHNIWIFADGVYMKGFNLTESSRFFSAIYIVGYDAFITLNNINNNYDGIKIDGVSNVTICQNTFINNYNRNIRIEFSSDCFISNNYIGGDGDGIYVWSSSNNRLIKNTIDRCDWGILLGDFCYNNSIYHNNLIYNDFGNAEDYTRDNNWDNGYPSGGNFWGDYQGVDADNDGIGDTAYEISEKVIDSYPLIKPMNFSKPEISIKNGFGFHAEIKNNNDQLLTGILTVNIYKKNGELKSYSKSTIVNIDPSDKIVISKNMFGFGMRVTTVEWGIWSWEQESFLFGSFWINL